MNIVALIPARGGSKGLPGKNIIKLGGKNLISYSIESALKSKYISEIIVSTDSVEIAEFSKKMGAKVPFLRPESISGDEASMYSVVLHAIEKCEKLGIGMDNFVLLQPTSPLRTYLHIDGAIEAYEKSNPSSVVSVVRVPHQFGPESVMMEKEGLLIPYVKVENQYATRQEKPVYYGRNGPAIIISSKETVSRGNLYGEKIIPYVMSAQDSVDIDGIEDLNYAEFLLSKKRS